MVRKVREFCVPFQYVKKCMKDICVKGKLYPGYTLNDIKCNKMLKYNQSFRTFLSLKISTKNVLKIGSGVNIFSIKLYV